MTEDHGCVFADKKRAFTTDCNQMVSGRVRLTQADSVTYGLAVIANDDLQPNDRLTLDMGTRFWQTARLYNNVRTPTEVRSPRTCARVCVFLRPRGTSSSKTPTFLCFQVQMINSPRTVFETNREKFFQLFSAVVQRNIPPEDFELRSVADDGFQKVDVVVKLLNEHEQALVTYSLSGQQILDANRAQLYRIVITTREGSRAGHRELLAARSRAGAVLMGGQHGVGPPRHGAPRMNGGQRPWFEQRAAANKRPRVDNEVAPSREGTSEYSTSRSRSTASAASSDDSGSSDDVSVSDRSFSCADDE